MSTTQITDVIIPEEFTAYTVQNSLVSTALYQSNVITPNGVMADQLQAGAESYTVPFWLDLPDVEADVTNDDPTILAVPQKLSSGKQTVRKSFLHASWSTMDLASELSGSDPLARIQNRVSEYWNRQYQSRLIASLMGVLASNVTNNGADMVVDISGQAGALASFNGDSVIDAALTLGDRLDDVKAIAMHSTIYGTALKNNEITFYKPSENDLSIALYKGMATIVSDQLSPAAGVFTTVLFGAGVFGFASAAPRLGFGTELFRVPAAGNGGGQTVLHSRLNHSLHPVGFSWTDGTAGNAIVGDSPAIGDLSNGAHWSRIVGRKAVPLAFLISK
jgi:hypothetical protein